AGYVGVASHVVRESPDTNRGVAATIGVVCECLVAECAIGCASPGGIGKSLKPDSRAETELLEARGSGCKTVKRLVTHSGVGTGSAVRKQRIPANCCVETASSETEKGLGPLRRVATGITSIRRRKDPESFRRQKSKAAEDNRNDWKIGFDDCVHRMFFSF